MSDTVHPGSRSETVRQSNLAAILHTLHNGGPSTRSDLVWATGLTRSAVGILVGEEGSAPAGWLGLPLPTLWMGLGVGLIPLVLVTWAYAAGFDRWYPGDGEDDP